MKKILPLLLGILILGILYLVFSSFSYFFLKQKVSEPKLSSTEVLLAQSKSFALAETQKDNGQFDEAIESYKKALKKLRDYKNLSPEQRAEVDKEEEEERERRKNSPIFFTFLEDDNIIKYNPLETIQ
jgi:hypothetical protein